MSKLNLVEFRCRPEDYGIIPEPYPARKLMPEWFRALDQKVGGKNILRNSTIKRCPPFLDAMIAGWIIPLAADVQFETNADASGVSYKWTFYRPMIENHSAEQVTGHPQLPKPPMKFMNYWAIKVPPGYSILFVPPLNRKDARFECMSGIVDCDRYDDFINFPFFFNQPNFTGVIKQGTPLVQVIPFLRDSTIIGNKVRKFSEEEMQDIDVLRRRRQAHESYYRDYCWVHK